MYLYAIILLCSVSYIIHRLDIVSLHRSNVLVGEVN